jgi:hypothetical protein
MYPAIILSGIKVLSGESGGRILINDKKKGGGELMLLSNWFQCALVLI